jgi:putative NADPH-quinone reductase
MTDAAYSLWLIMSKRILIIQGHPDASQEHYGHAFSGAYRDGAIEAGHDVRVVTVAAIDFPLLHSKLEWDEGPLPAQLTSAQIDLAWAEHIVLFFPLWLGGMPAMLKAFLEQVLRPGFAVASSPEKSLDRKLLSGRSARLVVTMGMPAMVYRLYFRAHSIRALERNILGFVGMAPIHETLIGSVETVSADQRATWLEKLRRLDGDAA